PARGLSASPREPSREPRPRHTCSARSIGSLTSITSSSTTWRRAPCTGASRHRNSTSTCTSCSSNLEEGSHERRHRGLHHPHDEGNAAQPWHLRRRDFEAYTGGSAKDLVDA